MKPTTFAFSLLLLVLAFAATALFAVPPTGTTVTVAVTGFHCQACPDSLVKDLAKVNGVSAVKATLKPAQVTAKLDESKITASEFVATIAAHPTAMDPKKTYGASLTTFVDSKSTAKEKTLCADCKAQVTKALTGIKGVSGVKADDSGKVVAISFSKGAKVTTAAITKALAATKLKFTAKFTGSATGSAQASSGSSGGGCGSGCGGGSCPMNGGSSAKGGSSCPMHGGAKAGGDSKASGSCPMHGGAKAGGSCPMHGGNSSAKSGGSCPMSGSGSCGMGNGSSCPMHSGASATKGSAKHAAHHHHGAKAKHAAAKPAAKSATAKPATAKQ